MKLRNPAHPLRPGCQERRPKVQRILLLPEPRSRHNTDPRPIQQSQTVVLVRGLTLLLRRLDRLLRQRDGGEKVHGSRRRLAGDAFHGGESFVEGLGAGVERFEDVVILFFVEGVGGLVGCGRVDHAFDHALADDGGAEHNTDEFVDLGDDLTNFINEKFNAPG